MIRFFLISSLLLATTGPAYGSDVSDALRDGNRLYDQGSYAEAAEAYNRGREREPDRDILNFNLGDALYKNGQYQDAIEAFTRSLNTENRKLEADAVYNIANAKYKLGSGLVENDLQGAANSYREALSYYKRAIEMDDGNRDARFNHELVERELKVLLDRMKNQPEQEQNQDKSEEQQQNQEEDNGQQQEQQQESGNEEENKDEPGEKQEAGEEGTQDQQQANNQQQEGEEQHEAPDGEAREDNKKMTPEEARMLLDAFGKEEALDNLKKRERGRYPSVVKDW